MIAPRHERLWTAVGCWLASLSFAGPGIWLSGRPVQAVVWHAGELILVILWLIVAAASGGWPLAAATTMVALYHLAGWLAAIRCGWKFRRLTFTSSLFRVLTMAGMVALAPLPAVLLAYGPAQQYLVHEYAIAEGSMAVTLLGQHEQFRCRTCGYRFAVGLSPFNPDQDAPANPPCPMCGSSDLQIQPAAQSNADRVLSSKRLYPQRWDPLMFRSPTDLSTVILKRVIGLPGEELEIIDGDVFINDSMFSKPPLAHQEMWLPLSDTHLENLNPQRTHFLWQPAASSPEWQQDGRWVFDAQNDREQSLAFTQALTDKLVYNVFSLQYIKPQDVHDIKLCLDLRQLRGDGPVSLIWERSDVRVRAGIWADGRASLLITRAGEMAPADMQASHLGRSLGRKSQVMLIVRDGYAYLYADGEQLCRKVIGPLDAKTARQAVNGSARLRITAANCRGQIVRIRLDHDLYYRAIYAPSSPAGRSDQSSAVKIAPGHYYVLGDNSVVSSDSRLGWDLHPSLQGKVQPGMVPAELVEGVATCVYWPLARAYSFR